MVQLLSQASKIVKVRDNHAAQRRNCGHQIRMSCTFSKKSMARTKKWYDITTYVYQVHAVRIQHTRYITLHNIVLQLKFLEIYT